MTHILPFDGIMPIRRTRLPVQMVRGSVRVPVAGAVALLITGMKLNTGSTRDTYEFSRLLSSESWSDRQPGSIPFTPPFNIPYRLSWDVDAAGTMHVAYIDRAPSNLFQVHYMFYDDDGWSTPKVIESDWVDTSSTFGLQAYNGNVFIRFDEDDFNVIPKMWFRNQDQVSSLPIPGGKSNAGNNEPRAGYREFLIDKTTGTFYTVSTFDEDIQQQKLAIYTSEDEGQNWNIKVFKTAAPFSANFNIELADRVNFTIDPDGVVWLACYNAVFGNRNFIRLRSDTWDTAENPEIVFPDEDVDYAASGYLLIYLVDAAGHHHFFHQNRGFEDVEEAILWGINTGSGWAWQADFAPHEGRSATGTFSVVIANEFIHFVYLSGDYQNGTSNLNARIYDGDTWSDDVFLENIQADADIIGEGDIHILAFQKYEIPDD